MVPWTPWGALDTVTSSLRLWRHACGRSRCDREAAATRAIIHADVNWLWYGGRHHLRANNYIGRHTCRGLVHFRTSVTLVRKWTTSYIQTRQAVCRRGLANVMWGVVHFRTSVTLTVTLTLHRVTEVQKWTSHRNVIHLVRKWQKCISLSEIVTLFNVRKRGIVITQKRRCFRPRWPWRWL